MARDLHQTWRPSDTDRVSEISLKRPSARLVPTRRPRGLVEKLAYRTDGVLVSQIAKLKPSDLKEPPELVHDLTAFASSDEYRSYRTNPAGLFPDPGRIDVKKRWLAPHRVGFAE